MQTLKTVIITLIAVAVLAILALLGVIYSGVYNVAATEQHGAIVYSLIEETVQHSIAAHAEAIEAPTLGTRRQILTGAAAYEAMCAGCHAAPGMEQGLPGKAMYPQPPRLDESAEDMTAAQLFWVITHGIKFSGMPAWGPSHSEEEIWSLVALIREFPEMSAAEYKQLQRAADAAGMGHHRHGAGMGHHHHGTGMGHHRHGAGHHHHHYDGMHAEGEEAVHNPAHTHLTHDRDTHSH